MKIKLVRSPLFGMCKVSCPQTRREMKLFDKKKDTKGFFKQSLLRRAQSCKKAESRCKMYEIRHLKLQELKVLGYTSELLVLLTCKTGTFLDLSWLKKDKKFAVQNKVKNIKYSLNLSKILDPNQVVILSPNLPILLKVLL